MNHTFHQLDKSETVPPYSHLAAIYDEIMSHVQYNQWANYVNTLIKQYHPEALHICDISCGTGTLMLRMASMGYRVSGSDYSAEMIKIANEKAADSPYSIRFAPRDMQNFRLPKPVHIIISLYDSVNYLFTEKEYRAMFASVYNALLPEGIFIFDISTAHNARKYFLDYHDSGTAGKIYFQRHSYYETDTGIQNTEFAVKYPRDDTWYIEHHRQQILPSQTVRSFIPETLFRCVGEFNDMSLNKSTPKSERIHFVLRKQALSA